MIFLLISLLMNSQIVATGDDAFDLPLCAPGTQDEQMYCDLDPNDCSRPIDEENQESCDGIGFY